MNKTFSRTVCILLLLCLVGLSGSGLAEATAMPINPPPVFGTIPTCHALFSGNPVDYQITLQVNEDTGLRTYTIPNPLEWGMDASVPGLWEYTALDGWQRTGDLPNTQVQLVLSGDAFEDSGFPPWNVPCSGGAVTLSLMVHLGEIRHLYAYVDYQFEDGTVSISAKDRSFTVSCGQPHEDGVGYNSIYASYDPSGVLAYGSYTCASADGSFTSYTVDADVKHQAYRLREMNHQDADGPLVYWNAEDAQWINGSTFEPADAPEGISPETLPFAITGDWAGIPFEQPGDKPEGTFPRSPLPEDPALDASQYKPWPQETNALYLRIADAGLIPALPAVSWATPEATTFTYTLTGMDQWGVQEAHMDRWCWDQDTTTWMPQGEPVSGQLMLTCPVDAAQTSFFWEQPTADPDVLFLLDLNRSSQLINAGFENLATGEYWQMDNQGGLIYNCPLDDTRMLEAIYDGYTLIEYNIHQSDAQGNPLVQACYEPTDEDPAVFELGCLFLYSLENSYEEALWIKDIGWYSYETGAPCDAPEQVDLEQYPPLMLK
ncbi:MAG: hypothetical protein E7323_10390 [Clostridiales bacterium]|nr:hypothetical protein [Clostridiales bacterium]